MRKTYLKGYKNLTKTPPKGIIFVTYIKWNITIRL